MTIRQAIVGSLLATLLLPAAPALAADPELLWSRTFPLNWVHYATSLERSGRGEKGLLQYVDWRGSVIRVNPDGSEVEMGRAEGIPWRAIGIGGPGDHHLVAYLGEFFGPDGLLVPVSEAAGFSMQGEFLGSYEGILPHGRMSRDGSTLVTHAGPFDQLRDGAGEEVLRAIRVHGRGGAFLAEIEDPRTAAQGLGVDPGGSMFAAFLHEAGKGEPAGVVARGPTGSVLWRHRLEGGASWMAQPGIQVCEEGERTAFATTGGVSGPSVVVLDRRGKARHSWPRPRPLLFLRFSPDCRALVWGNGDELHVAALKKRSEPWVYRPEDPNLWIQDVGLSDGGRLAAVSLSGTAGDGRYAPYVEVVEPGSGNRILCSDIPWRLGARTPSRGPWVHLAGDGRFLAVALDQVLELYRLPPPG